MIIPSIDLRNNSTVQLIGGREQALDAGDPRPIARRFALAGEVAVIDLDAAIGTGSNAPLIRDLLPLARCRVGGGIRSVSSALGWLDAGAAKVILGTAATPELLRELPAQRVIAALDADHGSVVVEGWRKSTGETILDRMKRLQGLVGGFLITFVEREGRLGGTNMELVPELVRIATEAGARVTIAGGVTTAQDIAQLDALGADAQVGMALYTGRITLAQAIAAPLRSDRADGLWPTVVTDETGVALGLAYSSAESLEHAVNTGRGTYHSRTRGLWVKGETSGNTQQLVGIDLDCDRDTLRFRVRQSTDTPDGRASFCHTGDYTCFGQATGLAALAARLPTSIIQGPAANGAPAADSGSYSARLLRDPALLRAKLIEEAGELADAVTSDAAAVTHEAADVMYFAMVAMRRAGVTLADVSRELDRRALRVSRRPGDAKPGAMADTAALATRSDASMRDTPGASTPTGADATSGGTGLLPMRTPEQIRTLRRRATPIEPEALGVARSILADVDTRGEIAVLEHAMRLGDLTPAAPRLYTPDDLSTALRSIPTADRELLERTAGRVRAFALAQRGSVTDLTFSVPGGAAGHTCVPVETAGCYAPGGRFPLPSSVLMTAITARAAGVRNIVVASPRPAPITLAAAAVAGADMLLPMGGAQAIAAMSRGLAGVPRCDMIVGPGNRYVTAAKFLVSDTTGIDMLAGPSELLIIADQDADPALIAADLLAQAEHDDDAIPMLIAVTSRPDGPDLLPRVASALAAQLADLPPTSPARRSLANGFMTRVASSEEAIALADMIAPEHLEIMTADAADIAQRLRNAGALFIGPDAAEVLGDFGIGPNHVLPTGGTGRFRAGLSVFTFLRQRTWLRVASGRDGATSDAANFARLESLPAHAAAAALRAGATRADDRHL
ncbi:MAG: histidinol dehydrogenase [Phycisphaerales bacterium]|jgi:histidinol dehydrogenase/phosphoribosyl-ATP pyrophosphohydrolase|nr:histidinol dehydrogenase [Phycisphaeraceae bacterium]